MNKTAADVCGGIKLTDKSNNPIKYRFSDLVDIELLQQLLHSFYIATGIPHTIRDVDYNILSMSGWQDICTRFHRVCPQTEERCQQSDRYISDYLHEKSYVGYKCLNGLMDYASPIIIEGHHLATLFMGQILHDQPDEVFFGQQAQQFGFDQTAYLDALHQVPIIPEEQVKSIMEFYSQLGQVLAYIGLEKKLKLEAADQAVKQKEERLALMFEASSDGFWDWNIETDEVYYSQRWAEIIGYSLEESEFNFHAWEKRIHPDDVAATMKALNDYLEGRKPKYEAEYRLLAKSGQWKWILEHGQVVSRNEQSQPLRMVGSSIDISNRKQAEMALRLSDDKFYKAFHCSPDVICISTLKDGLYIEVNEAFFYIFGYTRQEAIGYTANELGIWAIPEERDTLLNNIKEQGSVRNLETHLRTKSRGILTTLVSGDTIDIDGELFLLSVVKDITVRKKMEEALYLSEERFSKAFHLSPVMMAIIKMKDDRLIEANQRFLDVIGYTREETLGHTLAELNLWPDKENTKPFLAELIEQGRVQNKELNLRTRSGKLCTLLAAIELINVNGESCRLAAMQDITEQKRVQSELVKLDQLHLVGEIAASIGHEIRNPMTSVRGFLQMFESKYSEDKEVLNLMIDELDRANSIITEFLSLAKNKMVELMPHNLNSTLKNILPLIQANATIQDKVIILEMAPVPDRLLDEKEIRQLILNLVHNGLEAMSAGGNVTIKTFSEGKDVVLSVQDQGPGIDPKILDRLGTPFFTTKEKGTGLGLAVCYGIAERHNAKIDFVTSPTGTTFYVRFPGQNQ